jgi:hypothetical protein
MSNSNERQATYRSKILYELRVGHRAAFSRGNTADAFARGQVESRTALSQPDSAWARKGKLSSIR